MQQQNINGVVSPLRQIISSLESPEPSGAKVWRRMTITNRERLARAAFVPESIAHQPWEFLASAHRAAITHTCKELELAVRGFAHEH